MGRSTSNTKSCIIRRKRFSPFHGFWLMHVMSSGYSWSLCWETPTGSHIDSWRSSPSPPSSQPPAYAGNTSRDLPPSGLSKLPPRLLLALMESSSVTSHSLRWLSCTGSLPHTNCSHTDSCTCCKARDRACR